MSQSSEYALLRKPSSLTVFRMLFDFYYKQNAKKPNSVHATFLIMGKKRPQPTEQAKTADDDSDSFMQSSPFASSMPEQEDLAPLDTVSFTSMLLVNQEDLERVFGSKSGHATFADTKQAQRQILRKYSPFTYTVWNRDRYRRVLAF